MMQKANFLILDEPTNHLDLDSKEVLENALIDYPGTILFVSHDRYFINRLATKVIELSGSGTQEFLGDYDYYVNKKLELLELERLENNVQEIKPLQSQAKQSYQLDKEAKKLERQRKRRLEEIEAEIERLEEVKAVNEDLLCDSEVYQDHEKVLAVNNEIEAVKKQIEDLMEEWTALEELDNLCKKKTRFAQM